MKMWMKSIALAAVFAGATACGGSTVSNKEYADSTQKIAAAEAANEQLNGMENTDAALYIRLAKESVAKADKLIADGDGKQAEYYLKDGGGRRRGRQGAGQKGRQDDGSQSRR